MLVCLMFRREFLKQRGQHFSVARDKEHPGSFLTARNWASLSVKQTRCEFWALGSVVSYARSCVVLTILKPPTSQELSQLVSFWTSVSRTLGLRNAKNITRDLLTGRSWASVSVKEILCEFNAVMCCAHGMVLLV